MYTTECDMHCLEHCKNICKKCGENLFLIFAGKYLVNEKMWITMCNLVAVLKAHGKCALAFVSLEE